MFSAIERVLIAAAMVGLSGCGSPRPIMYYGVQIPAAPVPTAYTYPIDMVVGNISGPDLLEATPIVYKTSRNQMGTYLYHRWTEPPVRMIQAKLIRLLRTSGEYQSVSSPGSGSAGDLVVRGRLYEFAEVDSEGINGLVSMEFELYNRKTAKILWSHFYSQTEPVEGKQVPAVVEALDRNLDRGLKEVTVGLGRYFAANPPAGSEAQTQRAGEVIAK